MRGTHVAALAAATALVLVLVPGALASGQGSASSAFASETGAWFVELSGSAASFNAKAKASGLQYTERYRFSKLWKGISVNANAETAQVISKLDGVVSVHPVGVVTLGPTERVDPELANALAMTGADVAQSELGLDGSGIQVGVMDTGIDYDNPALGGCFGGGCRVTDGHDFVGDAFNSSGSGGALVPHPDNDPDDCNGHGTHVAGIVGANGTVEGTSLKGVAPGVTFGAYRVFGCAGSTTEDIMIAAMEAAQADGMDIVNMSIGDAFAWDTEPFAQAMNAAVAEGTVVVISAGNSGTNGLFSLSSAGNARDVIGVASLDNSHVELNTFTVTPAELTAGYTNAAGTSATAPTTGSLPLAKTGTPTTTNDACAPADLGDLTGKAVLIRRGTCGFYEKSRRAQLAGASAVVLYNNLAGRFSPTVAVVAGAADGQPVTIPVVAISDTEGVAINNAIESGPQTLNWTDESGVFANATAGRASSFTSWGMTPSLGLKPDLAAPGGLIKSTYPLEQGGFATISGTSMAAPHVAGAAALYLEEHGPTNPLVLRTALQNSADPALAAPGLAGREAVQRQGAGLIDIDDAILAADSGTSISPGKVGLGEGMGGTAQITVKNNGSSSRDYTLTHEGARLATFIFAPATANAAATVTMTPSSFTLGSGASQVVDVTVNAAPLAGIGVPWLLYGGWLRVSDGTTSYRVPYGGFLGDYQSIQVLAPGACAFPGLFKAGGTTTCVAGPPAVNLNGWTRQASGATYNVGEETDRPVVLYHLGLQSERVELRAVNAGNEEFLVARTDLAERNPTNDLTPPGQTSGPGFFVYTWDGKAVFTNPNGVVSRRGLPDGTYRLRIVVTKALAEEGNAAHRETWTSDPMNIVGGG